MSIQAEDTIVALATPVGAGAIGVIRLSGPDAIKITNKVFKGKDLEKQDSHTVHFGTIREGDLIIDEVLVSLFVAPKSYTKENIVEISCHGSSYIIENIIKLMIRNGARGAKPGEFTLRAFLNGGLDLSQAEAVADLIASSSETSHQLAMKQMRGGFSSELKNLRDQLIHFASMIELELDFSEEDVEFANRGQLKQLILDIQKVLDKLITSFDQGNVLKNGVPVVIAGKPNVGKSTLLNALLNEERAIVSDIAGTTRDTIEDEINVKGVIFRFIDTAGIRETQDVIEAKGVERTLEKIKQARLLVYLADPIQDDFAAVKEQLDEVKAYNIPYLLVVNKKDLLSAEQIEAYSQLSPLFISAKNNLGVDELKDRLLEIVNLANLNSEDVMVSNIRHVEALQKTHEALVRVLYGIDNPVASDFLAMDIRQSLYHLGEITGEVTTDDLLDNIFSKFCIGK
ncbi:tRNA modification GTPase trmE [Pseudopedobacter saltans DSM 12145]|uniref:tRNA modification GTPase MnmE n=1 Tax=Pseudopedobacter saltans (strain ATCC 51119 / DSM 12145 / JCM 21818 / CCUG 39354 / LMG 10337 / NBRC 100064 / NCIMB 13643) TaxID=762903 RepID=F0S4K8_PSESL|nr:tRNA uridine-5-carboxymethylaminomethyl(34) synthesis GTPase MnmE [Pseudopedobacter saltans]ADY51999.1 tRNA modification GTPase trmE [Pseudopedobacter saltans DSM 12145]